MTLRELVEPILWTWGGIGSIALLAQAYDLYARRRGGGRDR